MVYKAIKGSEKIRKASVLALCIFTSISIFFSEVASAEESSLKEPSTEEITAEELKPEPLGDLFAIKLLEKIIELEDALKYLAKEVREMNERLTGQVDEMNERLTKLETAPPPPTYTPTPGGTYTPPPPKQTRFEVGDIYLGFGFKGHDIVYETTEKGTIFTGEIEASSTGAERAEFEIIVYDEEDKMIGFTTFWLDDIDLGESRPFEATVKGPAAHWIKRYEIHHLRSS
ncbi:MAG: FxLYD domain-containing protein [Candidatus Brocadiales bacterium]